MEKIEIKLVSKFIKTFLIIFIPLCLFFIIIISQFLNYGGINNDRLFYLRCILLSTIIFGYVAYRLKIIIDYKNNEVFIRTIFKKYIIEFENIIGYDLVERSIYPYLGIVTKDKKIKVLLTMTASTHKARIYENSRIRYEFDRLLDQVKHK